MNPYIAEGGPFHGYLVCLSGNKSTGASTFNFKLEQFSKVWRGMYVLDNGKAVWRDSSPVK